MIIQRPYKTNDIFEIDPVTYLSEESKKEVNFSTPAWTILSGSVPICIWGKVAYWDNRALLWGVMAKHAKYCMKHIYQFASEQINMMTELRLELQVVKGFQPGIRFAEMLGFECECLMKKYSQGNDAYLYARFP